MRVARSARSMASSEGSGVSRSIPAGRSLPSDHPALDHPGSRKAHMQPGEDDKPAGGPLTDEGGACVGQANGHGPAPRDDAPRDEAPGDEAPGDESAPPAPPPVA